MEEIRLVIALAILAGLLSLIEFWNTYKASLVGTFLAVPPGGWVFDAMNGLIVLVLFAFSFYILLLLFGTISDNKGAGFRKLARWFYAGGGVLILVVGLLEGIRILLVYV